MKDEFKIYVTVESKNKKYIKTVQLGKFEDYKKVKRIQILIKDFIKLIKG